MDTRDVGRDVFSATLNHFATAGWRDPSSGQGENWIPLNKNFIRDVTKRKFAVTRKSDNGDRSSRYQ